MKAAPAQPHIHRSPGTSFPVSPAALPFETLLAGYSPRRKCTNPPPEEEKDRPVLPACSMIPMKTSPEGKGTTRCTARNFLCPGKSLDNGYD